MRHVVTGWAGVGLTLALTSRLAVEQLWILASLPIVLWGLTGVVLLVLHVCMAGRQGRASALRGAGLVIAAGALFHPVEELGDILTERVRFARERPHYDRIVAGVEAGRPISGRARRDGREYEVDAGPPNRVAFPWPGGIVDNWCGIVHDASGEVLKVNTLPLGSDEWRYSPVTRLFGGDMTSCRPVDRPYYLCCFT